MTLTPSYGRDYRSAKAVEQDFRDGKDFTIASVGRWMGCQVSIRDLKKGDQVTLRYAKLSKCAIVTV